MVAAPRPRGEPTEPQDLLGRWLAHHEGLSDDDADLPPEVPAPPPVVDPVLDPLVDPLVTGDGPVSELDRQPPPGWEPVLLASVRKKNEEAEARSAPRDPDAASRLARLKARLVDPAEPAPEHEHEPEPEPAAEAPPPVVHPRRVEAELLAALAAPDPEPPPRPLEPAVRAVIVRPSVRAPGPPPPPEPEPEPAPVAVEPEPEPPRPLQETIRAAVLASLEPAPPERAVESPRREHHPPRPATDAARELVAANRARAATATATATLPAVEPRTEPREELPALYEFAPRRGARRTMTLVLLGGLAATAYTVRTAVEGRGTQEIGIAAVVVVATAVVWAVRAGSSPARLSVRQGQLEVVRQGGRHVFDLASTHTRVEVHGRPGRRGWRVQFPRRGMSPVTVDAGMVDPHDFMRVLRTLRPDLAA